MEKLIPIDLIVCIFSMASATFSSTTLSVNSSFSRTGLAPV